MKLRRRLMMLALSATMLFSTVLVVQAAYSTGAGRKTIYSEDDDLSLYGYIDLLPGTLCIPDEYLYNVSLAGSDVWTHVSEKTDNVRVKVYDDEGDCATTIKPYAANRYISDSVFYWYFSDYGKLDMKCFDATGTVKGY